MKIKKVINKIERKFQKGSGGRLYLDINDLIKFKAGNEKIETWDTSSEVIIKQSGIPLNECRVASLTDQEAKGRNFLTPLKNSLREDWKQGNWAQIILVDTEEGLKIIFNKFDKEKRDEEKKKELEQINKDLKNSDEREKKKFEKNQRYKPIKTPSNIRE